MGDASNGAHRPPWLSAITYTDRLGAKPELTEGSSGACPPGHELSSSRSNRSGDVLALVGEQKPVVAILERLSAGHGSGQDLLDHVGALGSKAIDLRASVFFLPRQLMVLGKAAKEGCP
jgi:hypothetical protein